MQSANSGLYVMNGKRYFFDTNTIVALLKGNSEIVKLATEAEFIAISVISRLEFFAFASLSAVDKNLFERFVSRVTVVDLAMHNLMLLDAISEIRIQSSLKLPDAIILASAKSVNATLITADVKLANYAKESSILFQP